MDAAVNRFICLLKRSGIGISPAEAMDAVQALRWAELIDRETVRTVLRCTLIKNPKDIPLFNEQFDWFFGPPRAAVEAAAVPDPPLQTRPLDAKTIILDTEDEDVPIDGEARSPSDRIKIQPGDLAEFGRNLILKRAETLLDPLLQRATHQINARHARASRPGQLSFADILQTLEADLVAGAIDRLLDDLRDLGVDEALIDEMTQQAPAIAHALPETLKRFLEGELARQAGRDAEATPPRPAAGMSSFTESERRDMAEIVRRLGRRMRGARSYRRVVSRRGRIHVARTLRTSMAYDGIPFRPIMTSLRREKPRIVVICDVSLSVRNTARFMLHLVHSLQSLFEQVRSYVFVSDLVDTSQSFEERSIEEAIAAIFEGQLIDCDADSNYGRALGIFCQSHLSAVTNETTVIVLGDGRGNRNPPNVRALEEIRRRCRQLVWLSPEPRGSWGLGSSDMPLYEPVCHRAEVVRNLKQLGTVAEDLIRRPAAGGSPR